MAGNITYLNIEEKDFLNDKRPLFKHMSLEYALKTLNDKELWFANPTTWKDPFESRFLNAKYKDQSTKQKIDHPWRDNVFCMCVTQRAASEAYWTPYSQNQIGIQFRIYRETLVKTLMSFSFLRDYDIYIGKVEYMMTREIERALNNIPLAQPAPPKNTDMWWARLLLLKRNAYIYEDEIRIIAVRKNKKHEMTKGIQIKYACDHIDLIQSIGLDPNLQKNTEKLLRDVFEGRYGFSPIQTNNGLHPRVYKSRLYKELDDHVYFI